MVDMIIAPNNRDLMVMIVWRLKILELGF